MASTNGNQETLSPSRITQISLENPDTCLLCAQAVEQEDPENGSELRKQRIISLCQQMGMNSKKLPVDFSLEKFPFCGACGTDLKTIWDAAQIIKKVASRLQTKVSDCQWMYTDVTHTAKFLKLRLMILKTLCKKQTMGQNQQAVAAPADDHDQGRPIPSQSSTPESSVPVVENPQQNDPNLTIRTATVRIEDCMNANREFRLNSTFDTTQMASIMNLQRAPRQLQLQNHNDSDVSESSYLAPTPRTRINPLPSCLPPQSTQRARRGDSEYECAECDESFGSLYSLRMHQKRKHAVVQKAPTTRATRTKIAVKEPRVVSEPREKLISCPELGCSKMFAQRNHLTSHMRAHKNREGMRRKFGGISLLSYASSSLKLRKKSVKRLLALARKGNERDL